MIYIIRLIKLSMNLLDTMGLKSFSKLTFETVKNFLIDSKKSNFKV